MAGAQQQIRLVPLFQLRSVREHVYYVFSDFKKMRFYVRHLKNVKSRQQKFSRNDFTTSLCKANEKKVNDKNGVLSSFFSHLLAAVYSCCYV